MCAGVCVVCEIGERGGKDGEPVVCLRLCEWLYRNKTALVCIEDRNYKNCGILIFLGDDWWRRSRKSIFDFFIFHNKTCPRSIGKYIYLSIQ